MKVFIGALCVATLIFAFPARPRAEPVFVCGYDVSRNLDSGKSNIVISVDGNGSVAVACDPNGTDYRETFRLVEDTPTDIVFSTQNSASSADQAVTSVFGLDLRTGRLYHCLNRFRMPGNPVWVADCLREGSRQAI
ncbi:hypothetical protein [Burkholderia glumae]|uniref:Uncharacterized protein n=1 Tax=Burkholderia glumae TaxID=337 RepID=A0AAQ0BSN5_BURGL|nr:hypothetical protein [Burkholderia glumae]AJY62890.1 hypothetical protein KS03_3440 [Burkholderia glumae LMG 2196 = ATCC 33617]KHJ61433.1 hypothetical protein NCPPB3923_18760 [Burkholderia glumae]MCM2484021.1 hypothetical protein [Burkholderia glumae]MCM2494366.1 hypothetical protein [Burkholderia glumae]MCM2509713.1 hypothetical protein [Burkholderia glumae]